MTLLMRDQENIEKGRTEGKMDTLLSLVKEGLLSITDAARKAGMELSEFERVYKNYHG